MPCAEGVTCSDGDPSLRACLCEGSLYVRVWNTQEGFDLRSGELLYAMRFTDFGAYCEETSSVLALRELPDLEPCDCLALSPRGQDLPELRDLAEQPRALFAQLKQLNAQGVGSVSCAPPVDLEALLKER